MNNHLPACEPWAEAISLLAAGCLTPDEELAARQHLAECANCCQRLEHLHAVCAAVQTARPEAPIPAVANVVARAMAEIEEKPTPVASHGASHARSTLRRQFVAVMAIAASVLVLVGGWSFFSVASRTPVVVHHDPPKSVPQPEKGPVTVGIEKPVVSSQPTWLALQRAAAQSDEAFDTLLARGSEAIHFSPLDTQSLFLETNP